MQSHPHNSHDGTTALDSLLYSKHMEVSGVPTALSSKAFIINTTAWFQLSFGGFLFACLFLLFGFGLFSPLEVSSW